MHLKTIKTAAELPIKGVELIKTDGNITEVVLAGKVRVKVAGAYSSNLALLIEQPFEEAERHRVTVKHPIFGSKATYYDSTHDAGEAAREFEKAGAEVEQDKVTALIDDGGNVVGIAGNAAAQMADCDIPF